MISTKTSIYLRHYLFKTPLKFWSVLIHNNDNVGVFNSLCSIIITMLAIRSTQGQLHRLGVAFMIILIQLIEDFPIA